jgi:hypothetical protein
VSLRPYLPLFEGAPPGAADQDGSHLDSWWLGVASTQPEPIRISETRNCYCHALSIRRVHVLLPVDAPPLPGLIVRFPGGPDASDPPQIYEPFSGFRLEPGDPALFLTLAFSEIPSHLSARASVLESRVADPDFREAVACLWDFLSLPRRLRDPFCAATLPRLLSQLASGPSPGAVPATPRSPRPRPRPGLDARACARPCPTRRPRPPGSGQSVSFCPFV